ncbi:MAG: sel1 repeat family protein, partial [Rhodospirillales bacterium]
MAAITLLILALALVQPVAAQSINAGLEASSQKDYATALKHFRPLAEQGHAEAQFWLGHMYYLGEGVTQDYAEAL